MKIEENVDKNLVHEVIDWRRYIHQNPELSYQEYKTKAFIMERLESFGDLEIVSPTNTCIVAKLKGTNDGIKIALRADIDALPIEEEWESSYKSVHEGIMHACGHDGHTSMLLGAAKYLVKRKKDIKGEIYFIFQHAEEMFPGGASEIVNTGVLDEVDEIYGLHLFPFIETGKVAISEGFVTANSDTFDIELTGGGGHASEPHKTTDTILVGTDIISSLQSIVSRKINPYDPTVLSVTEFHAGSAKNILPSKVSIGGGVRSFGEENRERIKKHMEKIINSHASLNNLKYSFQFTYGYKSVYNDPKIVKNILKAFKERELMFEFQEMPEFMGGEDFSAYLDKIPGCFIGIGAAPSNEIFPLHHPKFNIDEKSLEVGLNILTGIALKN